MSRIVAKIPTTGLLVSVRNAEEARLASQGGASVIDVKEPANGPLGAADAGVVLEVLHRVEGRRPVTAAWGELIDNDPASRSGLFGSEENPRPAALKIGLSRFRGKDWAAPFAQLRDSLPASTELIPAVYADHEEADSPTPEEVIERLANLQTPRLVIDTWNKSPHAAGLLQTLGGLRLRQTLRLARERGVHVALAGKLGLEDACKVLELAGELEADVLIGVRGGVCRGGRGGVVSHTAVARFTGELRTRLAQLRSSRTIEAAFTDYSRRSDAQV